VLLLAYVGLPLIRRQWSVLAPVKAPAPAVTILLSTVALVVVALGVSAILFQSNVLFDPTIVGNDIDVEALRAQSITWPGRLRIAP
jgi:hypothetical protein